MTHPLCVWLTFWKVWWKMLLCHILFVWIWLGMGFECDSNMRHYRLVWETSLYVYIFSVQIPLFNILSLWLRHWTCVCVWGGGVKVNIIPKPSLGCIFSQYRTVEGLPACAGIRRDHQWDLPAPPAECQPTPAGLVWTESGSGRVDSHPEETGWVG